MTDLTDFEDYQIANTLVILLEQRVKALRGARLAKLNAAVQVRSPNQAYWYVANSDGRIQILQDAAFMCTGIHIIGSEQSNDQFTVDLSNGWPPRQATQNAAIPLSFTSYTQTQMVASNAIPTLHFLPVYSKSTSGQGEQIVPFNADYWFATPAEWLIERGDTIQCTFSANSETTPTVILSGYKVIG